MKRKNPGLGFDVSARSAQCLQSQFFSMQPLVFLLSFAETLRI